MSIAARTRRQKRDRTDRVLAIIAIITIGIAWFIGNLGNGATQYDCVSLVFPEATECREIGTNMYEGVRVDSNGNETLIGWATIEEAPGYTGPVSVMVGVSPAGELLGVRVVEQSETPAYFSLIESSEYYEEFIGMGATSPFQLGEDIDSVTRATFTSRAVVEAAREASYTIAETQLGLEVKREPKPFVIGVPEYILVALFAVGFIAHRGGFPYKKVFRWGSLLVGMVVLGFMYNLPITLSHFNSLIIGYWPDWHNNIYWFLLLGGFIFVVTVDGKNPYCQWFCPFGAAQECLAVIGGAKLWLPRRGRFWLQWLQRGLAWSAIILGLLLRNPGVSSYEVFGALFSFNATGVQWAILIIILLLSLFVRRPWCNYLCPVDPVVDFIFAIRRWISQGISQWQKQRALAQQ